MITQSDLSHFVPRVLHIFPIGMLTMNTSISREDFIESKDTKNISNLAYVTPIQAIEAVNRICDHLY